MENFWDSTLWVFWMSKLFRKSIPPVAGTKRAIFGSQLMAYSQAVFSL